MEFIPVLVGMFLAVALGVTVEEGSTAGQEVAVTATVASAQNEIGWP
ncbi:hypothetical protein [Streptomyces sp. cmx-4-9]